MNHSISADRPYPEFLLSALWMCFRRKVAPALILAALVGSQLHAQSASQPLAPQPLTPQQTVPSTSPAPAPQMAANSGVREPTPSPSASLSSPPTSESPSLDSTNAISRSVSPKSLGNFQLPSNAGQQWVEYDIRPFTRNLKNVEKPQQWLVDWILRETGTDIWFHEPMGVLSADRDVLRVYHTQSMQKRVAEIYEKFVNGVTEPQIYGLRIITVANPQWRTNTMSLMRSVPSKSPGVSAWLMPKENGAIFLAQLRERSDARELQAVEIPLYNGQLQYLEQLRSRNYLKEFARNTATPYPPFQPVSDELKEGYKIQISPLLNLDGKSADLLLKCEIDQVEKLNPVRVDLPIPGYASQQAQIEVPQVVSWRLQERFQWPTDQILLLSCGVVGTPSGPVDNTLLGNPPALFGLNKLVPASGQRSDALLWIEYKGTASHHLGTGMTPGGASANANSPPSPNAASATTPQNAISRGRY